MISSPRMAGRMAANGGFLPAAIQKWLGKNRMAATPPLVR